MKAVVLLAQRPPRVRRLLGDLRQVVEGPVLTLGGALDDQDAGRRHGRDGARQNLPSLERILGRDLAQLADVEPVDCARPHRCGDADRRAVVRKDQFRGGLLLERELGFNQAGRCS
jgi:hypothetical protein